MTDRAEGPSPTAVLAEYAAGLAYDDIPAQVVAHAKRLILDTAGAALYGSTLPWGGIMAEFVGEQGHSGTSTVLGRFARTSPADAALANGTFTHSFELDDLHRDALIHAGSVTFIPALALAEARPVSGRDFLAAVVAGCEVGARVGLATGLIQLQQGYHTAATTGTFCAGATAGRILGLEPGRMVHSLGIAGTQAAGLIAAQHGSMVKRMHMGRAAQAGVYGALLAGKGFTGIADILEAPYGGFVSVLAPAADRAQLTADLGRRWETCNIGFKPYSSCGSTHTCIDALLAIMAEDPEVGPESVEGIDLEMQTVTCNHVGWAYEPVSPTAAQLNASYCLAVALHKGDVFIDDFTPEAIARPEYVALARRVRTRASAELDAQGLAGRHTVRMEVVLRSGRRFRAERQYARGSFKAPLTAADVDHKFRRLAASVLPQGRVEALAAAIARLEELPDAARALTLAMTAA